MFSRKQALIAAIASTVAGVICGINLALDLLSPTAWGLIQHGLLTLVWLTCAGCWWAQWARMKPQRSGT